MCIPLNPNIGAGLSGRSGCPPPPQAGLRDGRGGFSDGPWLLVRGRLPKIDETVSKAIGVTAARIIRGGPNIVQVVPLTRTIRTSSTETLIDPHDDNRRVEHSSAQCQHVRSVATTRIPERTGHVGRVVINEVRETLALLLDL